MTAVLAPAEVTVGAAYLVPGTGRVTVVIVHHNYPEPGETLVIATTRAGLPWQHSGDPTDRLFTAA